MSAPKLEDLPKVADDLKCQLQSFNAEKLKDTITQEKIVLPTAEGISHSHFYIITIILKIIIIVLTSSCSISISNFISFCHRGEHIRAIIIIVHYFFFRGPEILYGDEPFLKRTFMCLPRLYGWWSLPNDINAVLFVASFLRMSSFQTSTFGSTPWNEANNKHWRHDAINHNIGWSYFCTMNMEQSLFHTFRHRQTT